MPVKPTSAVPQQMDLAAPQDRGYGPVLAVLATLFFMWGFISVINNTLLPHLRAVFDLSVSQRKVSGAPARRLLARSKGPRRRPTLERPEAERLAARRGALHR